MRSENRRPENHVGPDALVRAGERSSPICELPCVRDPGAELRSAGRVRAPAPTRARAVRERSDSQIPYTTTRDIAANLSPDRGARGCSEDTGSLRPTAPMIATRDRTIPLARLLRHDRDDD